MEQPGKRGGANGWSTTCQGGGGGEAGFKGGCKKRSTPIEKKKPKERGCGNRAKVRLPGEKGTVWWKIEGGLCVTTRGKKGGDRKKKKKSIKGYFAR